MVRTPVGIEGQSVWMFVSRGVVGVGLKGTEIFAIDCGAHRPAKCCWKLGQLVSQGCRQLPGGFPPEGMY